jgi:hypothetical protein
MRDVDDLCQDGVEVLAARASEHGSPEMPIGYVYKPHRLTPFFASVVHGGRGRSPQCGVAVGYTQDCTPKILELTGKYWKAGSLDAMNDALDVLEQRLAELRHAVRAALAERNATRARELRAELRRTERAWDALVSPPESSDEDEPAPRQTSSGPPRPGGTSLLPAREQVHQALTLLGAPAAPKLIGAVHTAFFTGTLAASRLTSLRRDEERSYRSSPNARPYYLCPALTSDLLSPARALLTVSIWPLEQRIVGALSPRVDFLTAAIRVADAVSAFTSGTEETQAREMPPAAERLLWQFAANVPGALPEQPPPNGAVTGPTLDPHLIRAAAQAELDVHADADRDIRVAAARRARRQLDDIEQLFGTQLKTLRGAATGL